MWKKWDGDEKVVISASISQRVLNFKTILNMLQCVSFTRSIIICLNRARLKQKLSGNTDDILRKNDAGIYFSQSGGL